MGSPATEDDKIPAEAGLKVAASRLSDSLPHLLATERANNSVAIDNPKEPTGRSENNQDGDI